MRYLVAYDIPSDKRRAQLVRILESFGERVQYSLFECNLTVAGEMALRAKLETAGFFKGEYGALFLYPMDANAVSKAERYGKKLWIDLPAVIVAPSSNPFDFKEMDEFDDVDAVE